MPIHLKICGITRVEDLATLAQLGITEIGLNFVPTSKRFLSNPQQTSDIVTSARQHGIEKVTGVFAHSTVDEIAALAQRFQLDGVQLHDDSTIDSISELRRFLGNECRIIKVFGFSADKAQQLAIREFAEHGADPAIKLSAILLDTFAQAEKGGSGQAWKYAEARELVKSLKLPVYLAGGLQPGNVADAIRQVAPCAVDVASGVESAPGVKDPQKLRDCVIAARS